MEIHRESLTYNWGRSGFDRDRLSLGGTFEVTARKTLQAYNWQRRKFRFSCLIAPKGLSLLSPM